MATSQGAEHAVSVYPSAGTPAASPQSQISFRGVDPAELGTPSVIGSRSGPHSGRLQTHSDGNGASFIPDKPFSPGETVTVRTDRPLVGAKRGVVNFRIGVLRNNEGFAKAARSGGSGIGDGASGSPSAFHTIAGVNPPSIKVFTRKKGRAKGDIFLAPKSGQRAAMIVDDSGKLVWYHPAPHGFRIYDVRRQKYQHHNVLTWIEWRDCRTPDCAVGRLYNNTYTEIDSVRAGNGYAADFHDFTLSPQGTAYLIVQQPVQADLRPVHGSPNGTMLDSIVQEIDIRTGAVRFEWHALGHVPLKESGVRYSGHGVYDPYHINSVDQEKNGNLLISTRNTNAVYEVDKGSGNILWRLGGKKSSYKMGHGASFIAQHDVRRAPDGTITVFDNGSGAGLGNRASRAIVLRLSGHNATLVHDMRRPQAVYAASQGGVEFLPTKGYFVGWGGQTPFFSEFNRHGQLVYDARFANTVGNSYRAFRYAWHAHPGDLPAVAASASGGKTHVWVSWNGATEVAKWQILAGPLPAVLQSVKTVGRKNFETATSFKGVQRFVQLKALDSHGHVLGTSAITSVAGS